MHIFLIRHGESTTNAGENYVERIPDHIVPMTEAGIYESSIAGEWLYNYCKEKNIDISPSAARMWCSPFIRTRQTAVEFNKFFNIPDVFEDITLTEQQFGLFDAVPKEEWGKSFPVEYAEYKRQRDNLGKFYARLPLGESPFDVAIRVYQFIGSICRDYEKSGIETLFIFTHGTTLRTFLLRWFHYSPEWYHHEKNPGNCWIREIDGDKDLGYIYKGLKK